jgi:hypothetical protein
MAQAYGQTEGPVITPPRMTVWSQRGRITMKIRLHYVSCTMVLRSVLLYAVYDPNCSIWGESPPNNTLIRSIIYREQLFLFFHESDNSSAVFEWLFQS